MVSAKANVNFTDAEKKSTVLIEATAKGNLDIVRLLSRNNANVIARDSKKRTALMKAADRGYVQIAECFLEE